MNTNNGSSPRPAAIASADRPLGHLTVIALPGMASLFLGKWLTDLGAEVIRIEPPGGDPCRLLGPFAGDPTCADASITWSHFASGSKSVTADITTADGQEVVRRLIADANVVVEAFAPGTLDALGLGFEGLKAANPRLIEVSISPFGQTGPASEWLSSDLANFALGGYMHMTGHAGEEPLKPSAPYQSQLHAANHALLGLMMALRQARLTGNGVHLDVSMRDTGPLMLTHTYQYADLLGVDLQRQGSARDMGTKVKIRAVYSTADGHVVWMFQTGPNNAPALKSLVALMSEADMAHAWMLDINWAELDLRTADDGLREQLDAAFRAFFASQCKADLFAWALANRVMLAPVNTLSDVLDDPQLIARQAWVSRPGPGLEHDVRIPLTPVRMTGAEWRPRSGAPAIGEHTAQILREKLGLTDGELQLVHSTGGI